MKAPSSIARVESTLDTIGVVVAVLVTELLDLKCHPALARIELAEAAATYGRRAPLALSTDDPNSGASA